MHTTFLTTKVINNNKTINNNNKFQEGMWVIKLPNTVRRFAFSQVSGFFCFGLLSSSLFTSCWEFGWSLRIAYNKRSMYMTSFQSQRRFMQVHCSRFHWCENLHPNRSLRGFTLWPELTAEDTELIDKRLFIDLLLTEYQCILKTQVFIKNSLHKWSRMLP